MHRLSIFVIAFTLIISGILPTMTVAASDSQPSIEQTFQKAKQNYLDKNMKAAAEQIQKGALYVKAKAKEASDKGKEALNASAKELEKLAEDVKRGTVASEKRIEDTFARAYIALASDFHIKSTESWTKKEKAKAGDALDSAITYLEHGFAWTGQKIETQTKKVMEQSKELSVKLKEKGSVVTEDIGKGLKNVGNEIEKFGKRISAK